jgi:hypothetical protein
MRELRRLGGATLLAAGLLVTSSVRAADAPPPAEAPDPLPVPPGTPEDQALWRACGNVSRDVSVLRTESSGLQWRIRTLDLAGRLDRAAATATPEEAIRLRALRERLQRTQVENYEILTGRWPVDPTRGCQYPQLMLESAMRSGTGPGSAGTLGQARDDARSCVDAARLISARLGSSNRSLGAVVEEAVKAVPWPGGAGGPTGPSPEKESGR